MYRLVAPQCNENLINAFVSSLDEDRVNAMIDQAAALGFESLSLQQPEVRIAHDNLDPKYVAVFRRITDYAKRKGIDVVGAYELVIASRRRGAENNVVHPITKKPGGFFGQSGCVGSEWFVGYRQRTLQFIERTGFKMWDIDGPYHGEPCASTRHPGHKGLDDSQWEQWKAFRDLLAELLARDVYVPIPDWNILTGQSCCSMGYREAAADLPANLQLLLYRQYIYDGTWYKPVPFGWIEFTVGKLKPYKDHLRDYQRWRNRASTGQRRCRQWRLVTEVTILALVALVADGCWSLWRKDEKTRACLFGTSIALFSICFGTHAFLVDTGRLDSPYMSTYGFLVVVLVMGYDLAGRVMESSTLATRLQQKKADLQTAVAEERSRIASDLHDSVTQTLFSTHAIGADFEIQSLPSQGTIVRVAWMRAPWATCSRTHRTRNWRRHYEPPKMVGRPCRLTR